MIFSQDRGELRKFILSAWQKQINKQPIEPLEQIIVQVLGEHSEYHALFENEDKALGKDFSAEFNEVNPFLHIALHISIIEQLSTDQPPGVREAFQSIMAKLGDEHEATHRMMDVLAEIIWTAQDQQSMPDMKNYLARLQAIGKK
ncbi:MAG: DUF1841 family protein [Gammaproteobacteria bacterium]|nr:DUF1841 family protein [Gammaproteobacteria bacterium]